MFHVSLAALIAAGIAAPPAPHDPTWGELLRGEGQLPSREVERARFRQWIKPLLHVDMRGCPEGLSADRYQCWCERVCGIRFEDRPDAITVSYPFTGAGGPGVEVAPGGRVRACFYSAPEIPYARVTCPVRTASPRGRR